MLSAIKTKKTVPTSAASTQLDGNAAQSIMISDKDRSEVSKRMSAVLFEVDEAPIVDDETVDVLPIDAEFYLPTLRPHTYKEDKQRILWHSIWQSTKTFITIQNAKNFDEFWFAKTRLATIYDNYIEPTVPSLEVRERALKDIIRQYISSPMKGVMAKFRTPDTCHPVPCPNGPIGLLAAVINNTPVSLFMRDVTTMEKELYVALYKLHDTHILQNIAARTVFNEQIQDIRCEILVLMKQLQSSLAGDISSVLLSVFQAVCRQYIRNDEMKTQYLERVMTMTIPQNHQDALIDILFSPNNDPMDQVRSATTCTAIMKPSLSGDGMSITFVARINKLLVDGCNLYVHIELIMLTDIQYNDDDKSFASSMNGCAYIKTVISVQKDDLMKDAENDPASGKMIKHALFGLSIHNVIEDIEAYTHATEARSTAKLAKTCKTKYDDAVQYNHYAIDDMEDAQKCIDKLYNDKSKHDRENPDIQELKQVLKNYTASCALALKQLTLAQKEMEQSRDKAEEAAAINNQPWAPLDYCA